MNTFEIKTKVVYGEHALQYLNSLQKKKVFIVTDPFMVKSGILQLITKELTDCTQEIFHDIVPDPPMELVTEGVKKVIAFSPEVILALGGGSAIDAAKAIMHFSKQIGNLTSIQFIAIPTTSGTGSEVTAFSVITDSEKGIKYPLVSKDLEPDVAILETSLVKTLPPSIIADTGMDVLTHALEAYVSTAATDFSDAFAEKAIALVFQYLYASYSDASNIEAKDKMHTASCLAGIAFNLASLGVNHAIAHNIGGKLHVSHGRTNAMLLPHIIDFNSEIKDYNPKDYTKAAKRYAKAASLIGVDGSTVRLSVRNLINEIVKLMTKMNMPARLTHLKLTKDRINEVKKDIADGALNDACIRTNPRNVTTSDVLEILHKIS